MRIRSAILALALSAAAAAAQASVTFTDGAFDLAGYDQTPLFKSNPVNVISFGQCAVCGNPGSAIEIVQSFTASGTITVGFLNQGFVYDPASQGEILALSASVQKNVTTTVSGGNTFRPLIQQGGNYYMAVLSGPNVVGASVGSPVTTGYQTIGSALSAANFVRFNFATGAFGTGTPDFGGSPLTFGIAQFATLSPGAASTTRFDNLTFEITSVPPAAPGVPEPATWALVIGGFGLAGAMLRRRGPIAAT